MDNDVDLLFGTLAVQAGIITADQLQVAYQVFHESGIGTLAQVLMYQQLMTAQQKERVDELVRIQLDQHQGSARGAITAIKDSKTLAMVYAIEEHKLGGTVIYKPTEQTPPRPTGKSNETPADPLHPAPPDQKHVFVETVKWQAESRSRYTLTRVHGKGGLGQVWLAIDGHLNREVALKEVLPKKQSDPETTSRLMKEAQITGQLEHPNIVPVYELARGADGTPFYTMRFLRGQSLSDRIKKTGKERAGDSLELRELLTIFVSVCNAMGYAHARNVIHRDLKPQNIMLGDYGEVMVVDWGLAKILGTKDHESDQRRISVVDVDNLMATQDGYLLGSPAYMSPEQADGQISLLDARTDIYGLGAILFSILIGHAPHKGTQTGNAAKDTINMMRRISEGPTPRVLEVNPLLPKPLDAICAKAMAKKRSERYRTATELAQDITRWLADEPVSVYLPPWRDRAMRWLRRHRTWAQAIAVSLVLISITASTSAVLVSRARDRVTSALESEKRAHDETERALKAERESLEAERLAKAEATRRFKDARDTIDKSLTGVSEALQFFPGVEPARRQLLEQAAADYERFAEEKSRDPELRLEAGRAQLRLGDVRRMLVQLRSADQAYRLAHETFRELAASSNDNNEYLFELASSEVRLGILLTTIGPHAEAEQRSQQASEILDRLLAKQTEAKGTDVDRFRLEKAGIAINQALLFNKTSQFDQARLRLANAETELQSLEAGVRNVEVTARLAKTRAELGQQLLMLGQASESVEKLRSAVKTYQSLTTQSPDHPPYLEGLAAARLALANAFRSLGRDGDVIETYEASIQDYDLLLKARPGVPYYLESLAIVRTDLAQTLTQIGNNLAAKEQAALALAQFIDLVNAHSDVHRYHEEHATVMQTFGLILRNLNDDTSAETAFEGAIQRFSELVDAVPDVPEYRRRLASAKSSLGRLYQKLGRSVDAEKAYLDAIQDFSTAQQAGLDDPLTHDPLAWCHTHLADLLFTSGQPEKSRGHYAKAQALREPLNATAEQLFAFAMLLVNCDDVELRQPDRAIVILQQAVKLIPGNPRYVSALGLAYFRASQWDKSLTAVRTAQSLRIFPDATDSFVLALSLEKSGQKEQAQSTLKQAIETMDKHSPGNIEQSKLRAETNTLIGKPTE